MGRVIRMIILILIGFYFFFGAYKDYDWFFTSYKLRRAVEQIGRKNARIMYMIGGIVMMIIGVVLLFV